MNTKDREYELTQARHMLEMNGWTGTLELLAEAQHAIDAKGGEPEARSVAILPGQPHLRMLSETEQLLGKTVVAVVLCDPSFGLALQDGTFCVLKSKHGFGDDPELELEGYAPDDDMLFNLGLIDMTEWNRRRDAKRQQDAAVQEGIDRRRFEELKKKFGD